MAAEMSKAETFWLKRAQHEAFPKGDEEGHYQDLTLRRMMKAYYGWMDA